MAASNPGTDPGSDPGTESGSDPGSNGIKILLRYGTRALWRLPPYREARIKQRAQELSRETTRVNIPNETFPRAESIDKPQAIARIFAPLIPTETDAERVCVFLQQRIAEYAHEISGALGQAISRLDPDDTVEDMIGVSMSMDSLDIADIAQAYIGMFIYKNILKNTVSYEKLREHNWEADLHKWLYTRSGASSPLPAQSGMLRLVIDTAVTFRVLVDECRLKLDWPHSGAEFDGASMVSWSKPPLTIPRVLLALTFAVYIERESLTETEQSDDEDGDGEKSCILYPATVTLSPRYRKNHAAEEIERLRHLLTSNRRVWFPIQSSALRTDRDWCGFPFPTERKNKRRKRT